MKLIFILTIIFCLTTNYQNRSSIKGQIYYRIQELEQFKTFVDSKSSVIDYTPEISGDYSFSIEEVEDTLTDKHIVIFERILTDTQNPNIPKFLLLDTININLNFKDNFIAFCNCYQDTLRDPNIIAVVNSSIEKEYYDEVINSWRVDTLTGKILSLKNKKGIKCINEDYDTED